MEECFQSVLTTEYSNFEVIFVDNCSNDGSVKFVLQNILSNYDNQQISLKVVQSPRNLGFGGGNNLGMKYAQGDYIVFLNNDSKVDPAWISRLIDVMEKDATIGIAQCKILQYNTPNLIDSAGIDLFLLGTARVRGHGVVANLFNQVEELSAANAGIAMFRRELLQTNGGFDQDFFIMKEDDDISLRAWLSGWRVVLAPKAIVYHKSGGTRDKFGAITNIYYTRRNGIATMIKNYETSFLALFLPPTLFLYLLRGFFVKNKGDYFYACAKALSWVFLNLELLIEKRRFVQGLRIVPDVVLIARQILKQPTIQSFTKGF